MTLKNLYILISLIIMIIVNYFIYQTITNSHKTKEIKASVMTINNIAKTHNNEATKSSEAQVEKAVIQEKRIQKPINTKPLLSIIIDDVSFSQHLRNIDMVNIPLNLSFLPPTSRHKNSHLLATDYTRYMVHLPLSAMNYYASESETLQVDTPYSEIDDRIKSIRSLFPKARYINNHTGSKFTSDITAMRKLAKALNKYNFIFVDSVTTLDTKAKKVFKYNVLSRNVFLDNVDDMRYIKKQIRQAVKRAIKKGNAIAIGHARYKTLKALQEMSGYIQKHTKVVYIDELDNAISYK